MLTEMEMEQGLTEDLGPGIVGFFSDRSPLKSTPNEDAALVLAVDDETGILAVADGVGGEAAGEVASRVALEALADTVMQAGDRENLRSAIIDGFEAANRRVRELALGAATTMAVVEIQAAQARTYHAGDSMILVTGQRGKIKLQTISHSPVGYAVEAGLLNEDDALHHEDRHVVSNVIGMPDMRIEIGPTINLAPRDTLILASDGLFDNLSTGEIVQRIRKGPLRRVLSQLQADTKARMAQAEPGSPCKPDDLTFVLYRRRQRSSGPNGRAAK